MRPLPGGDAPPSNKPRSRKSSVADASVISSGPSSHVPTTFFMRTEEDMEQSMQTSRSTTAARKQKESNFGVQSLADTLEAAFGSETQPGDSKGDSIRAHHAQRKHNVRLASRDSSRPAGREPERCKSSPPRANRRDISTHSLSNSMSPLNTDSRSPIPPSAIPSTPTSASLQSFKLSDEEMGSDGVASQAVASGGEEEDMTVNESGSFPQLVMPSIQMPSRRPFTAKGKAMGKLKVLVAGRTGIGKTSLIRSIVQLCEDIVHVDPLSPKNSLSQPSLSKSKSRKRKVDASGTSHITETHASTKSYPPWWTDVEESRVLRRRKSSTTDAVLERNLCFVDTPGYSLDASKVEDTGRVIDYVEGLLYQTTSVTSMDDSDLFGVISGSGGIAVDVVLYLLPPRNDISEDIEFMQRLSTLTNLIPVIAKSDTLSANELLTIKTSILARLQTSSIKPFFFGNAVDDALLAVQELSLEQSSPASSDDKPAIEPKEYPFPVATHPYAVSSTLGPDTDTMDASLLMSPDYVQPLLPSELATLVNRVFDPDSIAWLRHSAAKKFLAWRRRTRLPGDSFILQSLQQQTLRRGSASTSASVGLNGAAPNTSAASSIFTPVSPSGVLVPQAGSPFYASNLHSPFPASSPSLAHTQPETLDNLPDFSLTRYQNAAQGEQRLAEVRLAKWATDLQRSLRNEKDRYEELQRTERAKWLLERVGEEVASGNIVASPGGSPRADWAVVKRPTTKEARASTGIPMYGRSANVDSRDPLGLCDFSDEVRRRGFVLVKVLGGVSVLGAVMVTVVRICGWETMLPEGGVWRWITGQTE